MESGIIELFFNNLNKVKTVKGADGRAPGSHDLPLVCQTVCRGEPLATC